MLQVSLMPLDASVGLANAVIQASSTPSLLLDAQLTVIAVSCSFCRRFGIDPTRATLTPLASLSRGEWDALQLHTLLMAKASGFAAIEGYEMDLQREGHPVQRLLIDARKLDYPGDARAMALLSVADVTEARRCEQQTDRLVEEKAVLLRELNHRVANSLQIIASVLMQSVRKVPFEEARTHINDAHRRLSLSDSRGDLFEKERSFIIHRSSQSGFIYRLGPAGILLEDLFLARAMITARCHGKA